METIISPVLGRLKITLPSELECALMHGSGYRTIEILRAIVRSTFSMTSMFDANMDKLEEFASSLSEWANNGLRVQETLDGAGNKVYVLRDGERLFKLTEYTESIKTWSDLNIVGPAYEMKVENVQNATINIRPSITMKETTTANGISSSSIVSNPTGAEYTYTSSDPTIAVVDSSGNVTWLSTNTGTSDRSVTISVVVKLNGETKTSSITVYQKPTTSSTIYTAYYWKQYGTPSSVVKTSGKQLTASLETLSVSSAISEGNNCLCVAIPIAAGYSVSSIADAGGDEPAYTIAEAEGYKIYYVKSAVGYISDTLTIKISK